MENTVPALDAKEAQEIEQALLRALAPVSDPESIAEALIRAFARIDAATESAS